MNDRQEVLSNQKSTRMDNNQEQNRISFLGIVAASRFMKKLLLNHKLSPGLTPAHSSSRRTSRNRKYSTTSGTSVNSKAGPSPATYQLGPLVPLSARTVYDCMARSMQERLLEKPFPQYDPVKAPQMAKDIAATVIASLRLWAAPRYRYVALANCLKRDACTSMSLSSRCLWDANIDRYFTLVKMNGCIYVYNELNNPPLEPHALCAYSNNDEEGEECQFFKDDLVMHLVVFACYKD